MKLALMLVMLFAGTLIGIGGSAIYMESKTNVLECVPVCGSQAAIHSATTDSCRCFHDLIIKNKEIFEDGQREHKNKKASGGKRF